MKLFDEEDVMVLVPDLTVVDLDEIVLPYAPDALNVTATLDFPWTY